MGFKETIRRNNINLLKRQIEAKGGKCEATVESIFENLRYLTEKGMSYGEEVIYLPLSVRRVIGSLPEDGHLVFRVDPEGIHWAEDRSSVTVGGYLVQAKEDGTEIKFSGYSVGSVMKDDVFPRDMLSSEKRESLMLSFAVGKAESTAYYNAGIGAEYKNPDTFELESFEENVPAAEPALPDPAVMPTKRGRKKKEAPQEQKPETADTPAVTADAPTDEATPDVANSANESEEATTSISLEEARAVHADQGNLAGKTLGEIADNPATRRNLVWLTKQSREDERLNEALKIVIESIPSLVEFMKRTA